MSVIDDFLSQDALAVVGVSRSGGGYGYKVFRHLKAKNVQVYPVNPNAKSIDGQVVFASVRDLPQAVGGVITVVPPEATLQVIEDCLDVGIARIWMQPGSESDEAIHLARECGLDVVADQCMLMA